MPVSLKLINSSSAWPPAILDTGNSFIFHGILYIFFLLQAFVTEILMEFLNHCVFMFINAIFFTNLHDMLWNKICSVWNSPQHYGAHFHIVLCFHMFVLFIMACVFCFDSCPIFTHVLLLVVSRRCLYCLHPFCFEILPSILSLFAVLNKLPTGGHFIPKNWVANVTVILQKWTPVTSSHGN